MTGHFAELCRVWGFETSREKGKNEFKSLKNIFNLDLKWLQWF
jgi:hypothetical protein